MPGLDLLLPLVAFLLVIGATAGVIAGLLGVGGGILLVPAFFFAFETLGYGGEGLMQVCVGTSLATILVTSARSLSSHAKKGAVDWHILRAWGPGIAIGALLGALMASQLKSVVLQGLFGGLGMIVGLYMGFGRDHWRLGPIMPSGWRRAAIAPSVGFFSALMGIGGGSFGVPLMTLYSAPIHRAVATSAGIGLIIAVPGVLGFAFADVADAAKPPLTFGAINLIIFPIIIAMTLLTAPLGVRLAHRMDPKPLKRVFSVFLAIVALNMLRKAVLG